jgi:hypothetical protein
MRSCISALQFAAASSKTFSMSDVEGTSAGRKDKVVDLRTAWNTVFRAPNKRGRPGKQEGGFRFGEVLDTLQVIYLYLEILQYTV